MIWFWCGDSWCHGEEGSIECDEPNRLGGAEFRAGVDGGIGGSSGGGFAELLHDDLGAGAAGAAPGPPQSGAEAAELLIEYLEHLIMAWIAGRDDGNDMQ